MAIWPRSTDVSLCIRKYSATPSTNRPPPWCSAYDNPIVKPGIARLIVNTLERACVTSWRDRFTDPPPYCVVTRLRCFRSPGILCEIRVLWIGSWNYTQYSGSEKYLSIYYRNLLCIVTIQNIFIPLCYSHINKSVSRSVLNFVWFSRTFVWLNLNWENCHDYKCTFLDLFQTLEI